MRLRSYAARLGAPRPLPERARVHPELVETLDLLKQRPRSLTLEKIASDNEVSEAWLGQVINGTIKDPGFNRVAKLRDYMRKCKPNGKDTAPDV